MIITIIGTGNVAYQLAHRFISKGAPIDLIVGRRTLDVESWTMDIGRWTLGKNNIQYPTSKIQNPKSNVLRFSTDYADISPKTDLIIIAVSDNAITEVAKKLAPFAAENTLVVHTSGNVMSGALKPFFKNFGGLYPLQTFTKESFPDFDIIPVFYNVTTDTQQSKNNYEKLIVEAATLLSPKIFFLDDADRLTLHISAVFVNNFVNHLFGIAQELLSGTQIPFEVLIPLINETVRKIELHSADKIQTGPAVRGDVQTIEKHTAFLSEKNILYKAVYDAITKSILER